MIRLEYGCALSGIEKKLDSVIPLLKEAHSKLLMKRDSKEVGFIDLPFEPVEEIRKLAEEKRKHTDTLVLVGIGGSSLGAECLIHALDKAENFYVLDNVDPYKVASVLDRIDPQRTCFNVVSKSGGTTETIVNFMAVLEVLKRSMLWDEAKRNIVITTDPEKGILREIAQREGIASLPVPSNVGGRFSVLSPVGLFPAAYMGVDLDALLMGAKKAVDWCMCESLEKNPAWLIASLHYLHAIRGKNIAVMMPYCERLSLFVSWWRQLWAESLGKDGKGQTPVKAMGTVDQHSQIQLYNDGPKDKLITFMVVEDFGRDVKLHNHLGIADFHYLNGKTLSQVMYASYLGTASALAKNKVPFITVKLDRIDEAHLGALFMVYEFATAISGYLYDINPFDQPGVEEGKRLTHGLLGREGYEKKREEALSLASTCSKCLIECRL